MLKKTLYIIMSVLLVSLLTVPVSAAEYKASADLEIFYENSDDINSTTTSDDSDQFEARHLYATMDGTFDKGLSAKLKLDGADTANGEDSAFVEEANVTMGNIGGSPISVVFGKDEMPFGLDAGDYIIDSLANKFEIDKVWGLHVIADLPVGDLAVALYESNNGNPEDEIGKNYTARITIDTLLDGALKFELSAASEEYAGDEDETSMSVGVMYDCPVTGINASVEYITVASLGGVDDYDPGLLTVAVEYDANPWKVFARYENIMEDVGGDPELEESLMMAGVSFTPVENYTLSLEAANYNTTDLGNATDLLILEDEIESSIVLGARVKF